MTSRFAQYAPTILTGAICIGVVGYNPYTIADYLEKRKKMWENFPQEVGDEIGDKIREGEMNRKIDEIDRKLDRLARKF